MFERIKYMLIKEFIQVLRDPRMKMVIFVVPVIQLILFGYAATTDVNHIATAVYDLDQSKATRELIAQFVESGYFDIVEYIHDQRYGDDLINRGRIKAILHLNKGFEHDLLAGKSARAQMIVDGTDSNTAGIILNYSAKIAKQYSQQVFNIPAYSPYWISPKPGAY